MKYSNTQMKCLLLNAGLYLNLYVTLPQARVYLHIYKEVLSKSSLHSLAVDIPLNGRYQQPTSQIFQHHCSCHASSPQPMMSAKHSYI